MKANITALSVLALLGTIVQAEPQVLEAEAIKKALGGAPQTSATKSLDDYQGMKDLHEVNTRGIGIRSKNSPSSIPRPQDFHPTSTAPAADPVRTVDLSVPFELDSAELGRSAIRQLNELAHALNDPALRGYGFEIIGHTDASGPSRYNQRLSEQRAAAVKDYLTAVHQVDQYRLSSAGMGEHGLINGLNPFDERNRRVEIRNIGGYVR